MTESILWAGTMCVCSCMCVSLGPFILLVACFPLNFQIQGRQYNQFSTSLNEQVTAKNQMTFGHVKAGRHLICIQDEHMVF